MATDPSTPDPVHGIEFPRFLQLFDQLAQFTESWLDRMPAERLDWAPIDNASMRFGDRVSRITVKGLVIHVCIGEKQWVEGIERIEEGGSIPIPKQKDLEQTLAASDWRGEARRMHAQNMARLRSAYTPAHLRKTVHFADHRYSGMGLLWAMYAHRAFHLGNIDIYLRQTDTVAPDFFRFPSDVMA
ncbi:MAG: DinB family protein [Rubrivivax sp.]